MKAEIIDTNRMSKVIYIALIFFMNLLLCIMFFKFIYNKEVYRFEDGYSIIYIICILFGFAITYRKHRTIKYAIYVVVVPFGIYCSFAYKSVWTIISSILLLISFICLCAQTFWKPIPKNKDKKLINIIRVKKMIKTGYSILGFYSAVLVITTIIAILFSVPTLAKPTDDRSLGKQSSIMFSLDDWKHADEDTKLSYGKAIVDYECGKLNIKPLTLTVSSKMSNTRLAYYSDNQSKIVINNNHLNNDSVFEICNTIAHECFHSAQHSLILNGENYSGDTEMETDISDRINTYKVEFEEYKSFNDVDVELNYKEFFDYYTQKCEVDARSYGDIEAVVLYKLIVSNN
jgi:hypothetical protein